MGIFGTIVGGSLGFMLGGPLGAILGGALGSSIEVDTAGGGYGPGYGTGRRTTTAWGTRGATARDAQTVFAVAITTLAAKVAKADGRVTQEEIEAFDHFLKHSLGMSVEDRRFAARVFNEARDSQVPTTDFSRQVRQLLGGHPDRLRDIVTILLSVALADGNLHPDEEELIRRIAGDMGLSENDYQSCRATFFATSGHSETSPYEVLGVAPDASDDEVRSAHRRLVREYHPDVLQSKGLPEDFMQFATEKLSAVNEAWSRIKRERGL